MTDIQATMITERQCTLELVEIGATRAAGAFIKENMEAVDDDILTLQRVRTLSDKLKMVLDVVDRAQKDLDSLNRIIAEAEEDAKEGKNDNHE